MADILSWALSVVPKVLTFACGVCGYVKEPFEKTASTVGSMIMLFR